MTSTGPTLTAPVFAPGPVPLESCSPSDARPSCSSGDRWREGSARPIGPERFSFVLKASRRITHHKKLRDADEELGYLVRTASELGTRLGPILFQLPPYLKKDVSLLRGFLALLPPGVPAAFEFRSSSWFDDEVYETLCEREVALVVADTDDEKLAPVITRTAPFGYARLRRQEYGSDDLRSWAEKLVAPGWDDLYVFFKHEEAGAGPRLAKRYADLVRAG